jgi:hypothetical protein
LAGFWRGFGVLAALGKFVCSFGPSPFCYLSFPFFYILILGSRGAIKLGEQITAEVCKWNEKACGKFWQKLAAENEFSVYRCAYVPLYISCTFSHKNPKSTKFLQLCFFVLGHVLTGGGFVPKGFGGSEETVELI